MAQTLRLITSMVLRGKDVHGLSKLKVRVRICEFLRGVVVYDLAIRSGRFLKDISADDVLFGNVFDRSLNLPYGSG